MSQETFEQLWKRLLIYYPECPRPLAQEAINTTYSRALSYCGWTGVRREDAIEIAAPYTDGTVSVTQGSPTVTGALTTFTSSMIGRQFFLGGTNPIYTIIAVPDATTLTLDRSYEKPDATGETYEITLVYPVMPSDFLYFYSVLDLENNWKLHTNFRQEQIDVWDARRSVTGTSWILAAATTSPVSGETNRFRYEIWPRPTGPKTYPIRYMARPALLSANSDTPINPIRGDVLIAGALSQLSQWPGTKMSPNPLFSPQSQSLWMAQFLSELRNVSREEQGVSQTDIYYDDWEGVPFAPIDARYLQTHDIF